MLTTAQKKTTPRSRFYQAAWCDFFANTAANIKNNRSEAAKINRNEVAKNNRSEAAKI
ncbi:MAG: hypothetical protein PUD26_09650 [bacterium]|nr:hypothetical protein [bacterium]